MRKKRAYFDSTLPVRSEIPLWLFDIDTLVTWSILNLRMVCLDFFAMITMLGWLRIEGVNMGYPSGHKKEDDVLRLGRKMSCFGVEGTSVINRKCLSNPRDQERACHRGS